MGTVKYTGPMASFHCPTNAEIRSLKVHFSPKQEGSGDPSPENVREIVGWDGVEAYKCGKNIWDEQWEVGALNYTTGLPTEDSSRIRTKNFNPILPNTSYYFLDPTNGGNINVFWYDVNKTFIKISGWTGNIVITSPSNAYYFKFIMAASYGAIYNHNISINYPATDTFYEPHRGSTTNYEFGVLGKNKFDPNCNWEIGTTYRYAYLPELEQDCIMSFVLKDSTIDISDIAIGFSYNEPTTVSEANQGYRWCLSNGTIQSYAKINRVINAYDDNNKNKICKYIFIYPNTDDAYNRLIAAYDIQIEFGSTATTYEPYDPNHTVYGGWVDLITGEVCEEWEYGDMGDLNWNEASSAASTYVRNVSYQNAYGANDIPPLLTDSSLVVTLQHFNQLIGSSGYYATINSSGRFYFMSPDIDGMTSKQVKEWMQGKKYCVYNTPTYYSLAPTQLTTFLGQNNVWSNADYVEVEYDLHETQDILARKQFIIANQPHVVTPAAAPLQSFTTDVSAPLKECKAYFSPKQDLHGYDRPWVGGAGKNLFNTNRTELVESVESGGGVQTATRSFNENQIWLGLSYNNYFIRNRITSYSNVDGVITVEANSTAYGIGFPFKCSGGVKYSVSSGGGNNASLAFGYYDADGVWLGNTVRAETSTLTTPADCAWIVVVLCPTAGLSVVYNNLQFEIGDVTAFAPYSNICPISGWTGVNVWDDQAYGGNINWNQLVTNGNYESENAIFAFGGTLSVIDNVGLVTPNGQFSSTLHYGVRMEMISGGLVTGHKCFIGGSVKSTKADKFRMRVSDMVAWSSSVPANTWTSIAAIITVATNNTLCTMYANDDTLYTTNDELSFKQCMVIDLTQMFGAGNEPSTVEEFKAMFPADYYPYNAGEVTTVGAVNGNPYRYIPITFPTEAGTIYGGYVDLVTGEVVAEYIQRIYDGSSDESWALSGNDTYVCLQTDARNDIRNIRPICDKFSMEATYATNYRIRPVGNKIYANTLVEWREWLAQNPIQVVYELAEPIHYSITSTQLKTLCGTNNIWSNAGDVSVSYWTH